jgi:hypothetical protein
MLSVCVSQHAYIISAVDMNHAAAAVQGAMQTARCDDSCHALLLNLLLHIGAAPIAGCNRSIDADFHQNSYESKSKSEWILYMGCIAAGLPDCMSAVCELPEAAH